MIQELFSGVRKLWDELTGLRQLHKEAVTLLCAHVLRTQQLGCPPASHTSDVVHVVSIFPAILTLLAAQATDICLDPGMEQVSGTSFSCLNGTGIYKEINQLQKIDACSVDLGIETSFFEKLLPCCHYLTVLVLDVNVSSSILQAARPCPLRVLHVSERMMTKPQLSVYTLTELVLGTTSVDLKLVLGAYMMGVPLTFKPAWPDLTHLGTGWCNVSKEFLLLALLFLPKIEYMQNYLVPISTVVEEYIRRHESDDESNAVKIQVPLKANMIEFEAFWNHYKYCPYLEHVTLMPRSPMDNSLSGLFQVSKHLPNVTTLRMMTTAFSQRPFLLPMEKSGFQEFRNQITTLELDGTFAGEFDAGWLMTLLQYFPRLRVLFLHHNQVVNTEIVDPVVTCFDSVTDIQCVFDSDYERFLRFLHAFPNVQSLTLTAVHGGISMPWECLTELRRLRILSLYALAVNDLSGLCKLPRTTLGKTTWKLRAAPRLVSKDLVARLRHAGWTWIPATDIKSATM
ncbi:hypothetical protein E2C01_001900 [Portunus trituberculatus]|uniref:Uncharacterized protein n=1 Tax=Portunus trituberculatus TaxID=210409 RepID=A0A5B7CNV8_PORTR|nr:hypothetical protein [Portunus trituberculatus]